MKVRIIKEWETVHFEASDGYEARTVELSINHQTGERYICSGCNEGVHFKDADIIGLELKAKAINSAVKWLKENYKED